MLFRPSAQALTCLALSGLILLLAGLWHPAPAWAGELRIATQADRIDLNSHFDHAVDSSRTAGADQMAAPGIAWERTGRQSFGYSHDVHWFRLVLRRDQTAPASWILRLGRPYLDEVTVYIGDLGTAMDAPPHWRRVALGDHVRASARPLRDRLFSVDLDLPADREVTLMIRVESTSSVMLDARMVTPERFAEQFGGESLMFGLFFGALGVLVLLHLTLGNWIGDRAHMYYGAFALTQFVGYLFIDGYGTLIFDLGWPRMPDGVQSLCNFLGAATATAMWIHILRLRELHPRTLRIAQGLIAFHLFLAAIGWGRLYALAATLAVPVNLCAIVIAVMLSLRQLRNAPRNGPLLCYFLAVVTVGVGFVFHHFGILGLATATEMPENILQISSLAHMAFLSLGLIYRIRHLERERSAARALAAEAAVRADGQRAMVAMLSHEFRSPLATIHSAAQMIRFRQPELEDSSSQRLERIEDTARGLSALIDVFLAGEALEQGRFALDRRPCAVADLVAAVLRLLGPPARRVVVAPFAAIDIDADRHLLAVALRNCLANALAYSPGESPVRLSVIASGQTVDIVIADSGPGMSTADLQNVGKPFFRGGAAKGTVGSGLGLSMVRNIAQAHRGRMRIDSALGQGTAVTLSLPRQCPEAEPPERADETRAAAIVAAPA